MKKYISLLLFYLLLFLAPCFSDLIYQVTGADLDKLWDTCLDLETELLIVQESFQNQLNISESLKQLNLNLEQKLQDMKIQLQSYKELTNRLTNTRQNLTTKLEQARDRLIELEAELIQLEILLKEYERKNRVQRIRTVIITGSVCFGIGLVIGIFID